MTNQEKREYLSRYQNIKREIARLKEEIRMWDEVATGGSPSITGMPAGRGQGNKLQEAVGHILERQQELVMQYGAAAQAAEEIETAIASVGDRRLQLLLQYRYLDGMRLEEIAVAMHYGYRQVKRLHRRALEKMSPNVP